MHCDVKILSCSGDNNFNLGVLRKKKPSCLTICAVRPSSSRKGQVWEGAAVGTWVGTQSSEMTQLSSRGSWLTGKSPGVSSDPRALLCEPGLKQAWILLQAGINSHCNGDGPQQPGLQRLWAGQGSKEIWPWPLEWCGPWSYKKDLSLEKGAALGQTVRRSKQEMRMASWRGLPQSLKSHLKTRLCLKQG